jgi:branched-chain amino acid transport system ATP-binding protein
MESILEVESVSKSFGSLKAVDDVSFSVERGSVFGIAGPNGAGKTTLFNIISGIPYRPDSGTISFDDHCIHAVRPHKICRLGLARTFQRETAFDSLTVAENVLIGAKYGDGSRRKGLSGKVRRALKYSGLESLSESEAGHLSLFEKKRLMLATALVAEPRLLLLDEPASGLTASEIEHFADFLRALNKNGITIILIEHVLPLLLSLSQRVMILDYGKKLMEDIPEKVVKDQRVVEAYLGGDCVEI